MPQVIDEDSEDRFTIEVGEKEKNSDSDEDDDNDSVFGDLAEDEL